MRDAIFPIDLDYCNLQYLGLSLKVSQKPHLVQSAAPHVLTDYIIHYCILVANRLLSGI